MNDLKHDASADRTDDASASVSENESATEADADSPVSPTSIDPDAEPLPTNRSPALLENTAPGGLGWFDRLMTTLRLRGPSTIRDDLNEALTLGGEGSDAFSPEERALLQNILRFREQRVEDVMVPRAEIHAVSHDDTLEEVLREFQDNGHSRMPVYDDTLDDPRGMVLVKDLLTHIIATAQAPKKKRTTKAKTDKPAKVATKAKTASKTATKPAEIESGSIDLTKVSLSIPLRDTDIMRKVLFVPPSMLASDLMARMQATRTQMALVIDEYGGTDGLVSLEDVVEEVVGEIEDEHDDDDDDLITSQGDGLWLVDPRIELEKLVEEIGDHFIPGERGDDVDTLGGLAFAIAGHVPVRGEVVRGIPGFELRVLEADPRRIRRLQLVQINAVRRTRAKPRGT
ncbi:CBS domain-containing protein [Ahrensia sp. R2A130]|uniref:CBS domain-containing protein n=1 Tax=Ahrensia sp. R2A130 TaxID=744979 RepID=UPI0001E09C7C|nr:hemolysin family protein [Ahrensia sp. R2A130]EFL88369.1 hemolysin [Ahrensia sp. R2A130]